MIYPVSLSHTHTFSLSFSLNAFPGARIVQPSAGPQATSGRDQQSRPARSANALARRETSRESKNIVVAVFFFFVVVVFVVVLEAIPVLVSSLLVGGVSFFLAIDHLLVFPFFYFRSISSDFVLASALSSVSLSHSLSLAMPLHNRCAQLRATAE